jgi:enoyl-[acyl-carrier protein] reductase II
MLRTPLCDLFGIEYPILLAGMGGVSMAPLVAAVSNAGGLGVMGAANLSPDDLRTEIRKTKQLTAKPFAVDLLAPIPQMIVPYLPVLYEEEVTSSSPGSRCRRSTSPRCARTASRSWSCAAR